MIQQLLQALIRSGLDKYVKKVGNKYIELTNSGAGLCQSQNNRNYFENTAKSVSLSIQWDTSSQYYYGRFSVK